MTEEPFSSLLGNYLPLLLLSMVRMYMAWSFLPMLGPHVLGPAFIRNVVIFAFSTPLFLHTQAIFGLSLRERSMHLWISTLLTELVVGSVIGFIATIPFWALDMGCYLMDTLRGSSMSAVLNPLLGASSSVLGLFFSQLIAVLFLSFGGLLAFLETLYLSYTIIPFGASLNLDIQWLELLQIQWGYLSTLGLTFALPAVTMMIMIDSALGLLNRAAKQLNVFFIAMPIKSLMTLFLLAVSLEFSSLSYVEEMQRLPEKVLPLIRGFSGG